MVGARRRVCGARCSIGAALGLLVSGHHLGARARRSCSSLERYGEKLEAVVGLIAIGVLLLITNWFFHKVYWSEWIGKFHRQRKRYEQLERSRLLHRAGDRPVRCSGLDERATARASRPSCSCSRCS